MAGWNKKKENLGLGRRNRGGRIGTVAHMNFGAGLSIPLKSPPLYRRLEGMTVKYPFTSHYFAIASERHGIVSRLDGDVGA